EQRPSTSPVWTAQRIGCPRPFELASAHPKRALSARRKTTWTEREGDGDDKCQAKRSSNGRSGHGVVAVAFSFAEVVFRWALSPSAYAPLRACHVRRSPSRQLTWHGPAMDCRFELSATRP